MQAVLSVLGLRFWRPEQARRRGAAMAIFRRAIMEHRIDEIFIGIIGTALLAAAPMAASAASQSDEQATQDFMRQAVSPLVQVVRDATARYQDVSKAGAHGDMPGLGCGSG